MRFAALFALTLAAACGAGCAVQTAAAERGPLDEEDAAETVVPDAGTSSPDATGAVPDSLPAVTPDAGPDVLAPRAEASVDARVQVPVDGGAARSDATSSDGGADAASLVDAAADSPICTGAPSVCDWINRTDTAIRAQLSGPQFQCTEGARKCGSINEGGTGPFTYPLICRDSIWRLGVVEYLPGHWTGIGNCSTCERVPGICDQIP